MYVLVDLEWYKQSGKPLMLTQIAALTVDARWAAEDLFYCRIQPQYQDVLNWEHWRSPAASTLILKGRLPFTPS